MPPASIVQCKSRTNKISHEELFDDHCSTAKMAGESGPTERAILFVKTKTKFDFEDKKIKINLARICSTE
jgi:hypothetical protein